MEGSLKRLNTDYIDLYFQARIDPKTEPEEVAETMQELMEGGKILHWGVSENDEDYLRRANAVCPVTAVENKYNIISRDHESLKRCQPLLDYLAVLGKEKGATPAQLSLAWVLHRKPYIVLIPGMRSAERQRENAEAAEITLTDGEMAKIDTLSINT